MGHQIHIHIHGLTDDDWSPEARKAAAEARKGGSGAKPAQQSWRVPHVAPHASTEYEMRAGRLWPKGSLPGPTSVEHRPAQTRRGIT